MVYREFISLNELIMMLFMLSFVFMLYHEFIPCREFIPTTLVHATPWLLNKLSCQSMKRKIPRRTRRTRTTRTTRRTRTTILVLLGPLAKPRGQKSRGSEWVGPLLNPFLGALWQKKDVSPKCQRNNRRPPGDFKQQKFYKRSVKIRNTDLICKTDTLKRNVP